MDNEGSVVLTLWYEEKMLFYSLRMKTTKTASKFSLMT